MRTLLYWTSSPTTQSWKLLQSQLTTYLNAITNEFGVVTCDILYFWVSLFFQGSSQFPTCWDTWEKLPTTPERYFKILGNVGMNHNYLVFVEMQLVTMFKSNWRLCYCIYKKWDNWTQPRPWTLNPFDIPVLLNIEISPTHEYLQIATSNATVPWLDLQTIF